MGILDRFKSVMSSNINALLDRAEDPEKMIDQILRDLNSDLGNVKAETASIMAVEKRAKRELDECREETNRMEKYAMKALEAGNEDDARKFLERKKEEETREVALDEAYKLAIANSTKMREMHDKLVGDIGELNARKSMLKGKMSVAKTQEKINKIASSTDSATKSISAFERMEEKANNALDEAEAMAELNKNDEDDIEDLAAKYDTPENKDIDDELAALKAKLEESE